MALTIQVIKIPVTQLANNLFHVGMNLTLTDAGIEVINKDYYIRHRTDDSVATKISYLSAQMQKDIDKYKKEKLIYGSNQLDTAVTNVQASLEV